MTPRTVRVRVAVAVGSTGEAVADMHLTQSTYDNDTDNSALALDHLAECGVPHGVVHFIEADVPIPEPQTIEGTVVDRPDTVRQRAGD